MQLRRAPSAEAAAETAARLIADLLAESVAGGGRASLAVSGGSTPGLMVAALAEQRQVPWGEVDVFQVDERVAPDGDPARNLALLAPLRDLSQPPRIHAMGVTDTDLDAAAGHYESALQRCAAAPPVLDVIHLGLGADGHTASLVPGDPVLDVVDRDVAVTEPYQGHRRMTLTAPAISRARHIVWLVAGLDKRDALAGLVAGEPEAPASLIERANAVVVADEAAVA